MLPIEQHKQWVEALQEEMFRQGDREKELRLEVSPMMDRTKTGVNHPDSQVRRTLPAHRRLPLSTPPPPQLSSPASGHYRRASGHLPAR